MKRCSRSVAILSILCQLFWTLAAIEPPEVFAGSGNLDSLVAPIALYPDPLLAQVLVASTLVRQVDTASEWVEDHPELKGDALTEAVKNKNWDNSIKGLVHFPGVLEDLSSNRGWSAALGAAYTKDPGGVMKAIQSLRLRAQNSGKLETNSEVKVIRQNQTIVIQPANPQVVYVPSYNPTLVYGAPVAVYPGYSGAALAMTGVLSFGAGVALGALAFGGGGCCWSGWGIGWASHSVTVNNSTYNASTHTESATETATETDSGKESNGTEHGEASAGGGSEHHGGEVGAESEHGGGGMHGAEASGEKEEPGESGAGSGSEEHSGESEGSEHGGDAGAEGGEHGE